MKIVSVLDHQLPRGETFLGSYKKMYHKKSGAENIPHQGAECRFKESTDDTTAKCSKPPLLLFSLEPYTQTYAVTVGSCKPESNESPTPPVVTLNCAWTVRRQSPTLNWKTPKRNRTGAKWDQPED